MTQDGKFHQDIKARGFSLSTCLADEILTSYDARKALQNALKSDIYTLNLPQKRVRKSISKLTLLEGEYNVLPSVLWIFNR